MNKKETPLLEVKNLTTWFPLSSSSFFAKQEYVKALNGVSFSIQKGDTVSVVGESGSGKSTLGKTIIRLEEAKSGEVYFKGEDILALQGEKLRTFRQHIQMVFQDPYSSLNPRHRIRDVITEPLLVFQRITGKEREKEAVKLLKMIGLPPSAGDKYPHQFSGGQRQRIGIARAISLHPELIICDEPVSALDVSVQAQVLNLLMDLKEKLQLSYLFISHDLSVVENISDRVIVMYAGKAMEKGSKDDLFKQTAHPYSKQLIDAVPQIGKKKEVKAAEKEKTPPSATDNIQQGCVYASRCPSARERCFKEEPQMQEVSPGHDVACFYPLSSSW